MMTGRCRHIYLGGNTRKGFVSYYDQILQEDDSRVFLLKGGPGTGKSTFIKRVVGVLQKAGCSMDVLHCSGDPSSLDGVLSPEAGIIVIDSTSPHQLDPACPGAREEIINLGHFWDAVMLSKYREDIVQYGQEKATYYRRAYHYLSAAGSVYDDSKYILEDEMERGKLQIFTDKLTEEILYDMDKSIQWGSDRPLFATAITPGGLQGDVGQLFSGEKIYAIKTLFGMSASPVLNQIRKMALACGFDTESFYNGFDSSELEHLYIPALGTAVVTSNNYHEVQGIDGYYEYPMEGFLQEYFSYRAKDDLKYNKIRFDELLDKAVRALFKARQMHSEMEEIYVASMDFNALNLFLDQVIQDIEGRIQENLDR